MTAKLVDFPLPNLQNIPTMLRRLATQIEDESYDDPELINCAVLVLKGKQIHTHAFGDCAYTEAMVMLDIARIKCLLSSGLL